MLTVPRVRLPGYRNMDHRTTIWSASNLRRLQLRDMDHRTTIYGVPVIFTVYNFMTWTTVRPYMEHQ